jgi:redox-sensitive bicupin YhaK (pirin superfamily)
VTHSFGPGRGGYAYLIEGQATFDDEKMARGDRARITDHKELRITAIEPSELILVDVPLRWQPVGVRAR